jgi:FKBP-type peptidyl-prolyl cis-trans isomerase FkpA
MSNVSRALLALACAMLVVACNKPGSDASKPADAKTADANVPADLATDEQKFGYAIGYDFGHQLVQAKGNLDIKAFEKGIEEAYDGKTARLTDQQRMEIKQATLKKLQEKAAADRAATADKNKADGEKFLADNGKKPGVKTTDSGLEYEVLTEGKGDHPKATDKVTVNYKGTLIDGTVFDSSYDRGQPISFPLNGVIPGWTEGVQLMTPGSKYKFYVPSKLAYGEHGAGAQIGPNSTLIFEVELVSIDKPDAAPTAPAAKPAAPAAKK